MTLTAIIPSLRTSIPDPLNANLWPERTVATTTDVVVAGVSLVRLVGVCDTPCVHIASGVVPGTGGRPAPSRQATAIVVSVTEVRVDADGAREILIDACLDAVTAEWTEMRLVGRASCVRSFSTRVCADEHCAPTVPSGVVVTAVLPGDLRAGDLLAIPCPDGVALRSLRPCVRAGDTVASGAPFAPAAAPAVTAVRAVSSRAHPADGCGRLRRGGAPRA